ncbi:MAG: acetate--CoA ligase family protein [Thermodesulfobacteriota bacterium]|nr:acetate--CoA ligase family protein [Thermodesulfobacteriota bacterium]
MEKLDPIFSPKSVAVLGASTTPGKVGHDLFQNILRGGFNGTLYPVNPKAASILCVKAYPSILDIPDPVDLAMIILPPKVALKAIEDCITKQVKGIVIVSAGFKEVGGEGKQIEEQITAKCREAGIPVVGPNCLGVINPVAKVRLNASFSTHIPEPGNISFISQSGALCTAVLDFAAEMGVGFSKFISTGNKADVDELDILRFLHKDRNTEVILMYMEELKRGGQEFIDEVRKITSSKNPTPILAIKSGRTGAGAAAASSHTGSIAGSEGVYNAIFEESGIIRVESVGELFDYAGAFAVKKFPQGKRMAIVTNAGGPGIVATDMTEVSGLELARFTSETTEALASHLPPTANIHNPVDVIGDADPDRYHNALDAVIKDENTDGALVILTPQSMTNAIKTAKVIASLAKKTRKPVVCSFMGVIDVSEGVEYLRNHSIPVYRFPENAARALGALYRSAQWVHRQHLAQFKLSHDKKRAREIIEACQEKGQTYLGELDGNEFLKCYGFNVLPTKLAENQTQAAEIAKKIGFPVVMKIVSPQIIHKSDAGGVKVRLNSETEVKTAFKEIVDNAAKYDPKADIKGVLVQKMAPSGEEVIMGVNRSPGFGHLIMFGLGGIFVELFKDVVFRVAPIGRNNAVRMVKSIQSYPMLNGFRGKPVCDVETIHKMLVSLSDMVMDNPSIVELDINPLLVHEKGKGVTVADLRMIIDKKDADAGNDK